MRKIALTYLIVFLLGVIFGAVVRDKVVARTKVEQSDTLDPNFDLDHSEIK